MNTEPQPEAQSEIIVCRVTPWYFRRMGLTGAFLLAFGLYFFYDGKFGYAKDNEIGQAKEWFQSVYLKGFDDAKSAGSLEQWIADKKAHGMPAGENGEAPKWASYAAQKGWPEEPKHHSEAEIAQQFLWGGVTICAALALGLVVFLNRNKKFTGHPDHMVMPGGREVRYADVFKVDKRKWNNKGLAYVFYRREGKEGRVTVDDLKYDRADRVLKRLLGTFSGELIEKAPDEEETDPQGAPPPAAPSPQS
jgi:hypothetical protein